MEKYEISRPLKSFDYNKRIVASHHKGESQNKTTYCEDIITFDIETTSFFYGDDLKPKLYKPGKDPDYWTNLNAGAIPYLWQIGINDNYFYGRDISDFYEALADIPAGMKMKIFVHSLSFEWHFLDRLHWDYIFAKSRHRPIKAICQEYPNIEFCCTLAMMDISIEEWGETLGIPKLELDYNKLRTPLTRLNKNNLEYGKRDIEIMYHGLKEEVDFYGSVWNLPMTSTGAVRQYTKDLLMDNDDYKRYIKKLIPANWYQYATSRKVFWGGFAHGNRCWTGITWINQNGDQGDHVDYISAYIAAMFFNKFPCTQWSADLKKQLPDPEKDFNVKCYKLKLRFTNIRCEYQNTYIPFDKVKSENAKVDNGKIISADWVEMWCTCLDYYVIRQMYTWGKNRKDEHEGVEVLESWYAYMDYLPIVLVNELLDLFQKKTSYKNVNPLEYRRAKRRLDSIYGMAATSLIQANINWDINKEEWSFDKITARDVEDKLFKLRYWKDRRYFISYDWGVFIPAWQRYTLLTDVILPNDRYCMYSDTDSAFLRKRFDIDAYNQKVKEKLLRVCAERHLDPEKAMPKDSKGNVHILGGLSREPDFSEFRCLGSKRYCERRKDSGELVMTVSGVNKEAVESLKNDINNFAGGTVFDKDSKEVSKLLHTYFDRQPDIVFPDGYVSHQRRGVNLRPNGYKLKGEKRDPKEVIKDICKGARVSEYEKHLRGVVHDGGTD